MYSIFEDLCKAAGITPYRVCKDTGMSTSMISNWKAGRYTPKADKLKIIADYFGVPLDYIRTGREPDSFTPYYLSGDVKNFVDFILHNPEYKDLFFIIERVRKDDIQFIRQTMERLTAYYDRRVDT